MALGLSFQPSGENAGYSDRRQGGSGGGSASAPAQTPVQTAIKMLSLRLPTRVSPSAIAPQALLQGQGAAGMGGDPIANLINSILQASGTQAPPSPVQAPQAQASPMPQRGGFNLPGERIPQPSQAPQQAQAAPQQPSGGWLGGLIDNGAIASPAPMQPPPMRVPGTRVIPGQEAPDESPIAPPQMPDTPFDPGRGMFGMGGQDSLFDVLGALYGRKAGLFR